MSIESINFLSVSLEPIQNLQLMAEKGILETKALHEIKEKIEKEQYPYHNNLYRAVTISTFALGILLGTFVNFSVGAVIAGLTIIPVMFWHAYGTKENEDYKKSSDSQKELQQVYKSIKNYLLELRDIKQKILKKELITFVGSSSLSLEKLEKKIEKELYENSELYDKPEGALGSDNHKKAVKYVKGLKMKAMNEPYDLIRADRFLNGHNFGTKATYIKVDKGETTVGFSFWPE